jgi:hypothetical protein
MEPPAYLANVWNIQLLTCVIYIVTLVANPITNLFIKSYDAGIKNKVYLTWRLSCISENYSMVSLEEQ